MSDRRPAGDMETKEEDWMVSEIREGGMKRREAP